MILTGLTIVMWYIRKLIFTIIGITYVVLGHAELKKSIRLKNNKL